MDYSFMNVYHTSSDLEYLDSLRRENWKEHMELVHSEQIAGQETPDDYTDDVFDYEYAHDVIDSGKMKKFNRNRMRFRSNNVENMMSDTVLSIPEDMLQNRFNRFSRYGYLDPAGELITGAREYLFFSKPDLHLLEVESPYNMYKDISNIPFFVEAFNRYKLSYYSLQQSFAGNSNVNIRGMNIDLRNKYVNLLSNMVTSSLDLPDISASDVLNNQNLYQINTSYREGSLGSDLQYDFSLEFKDTKYFDVYMLFKIYDEYFRQKYYTEIVPTRYDYIISRIYPEALSIWKVIVDDAGRIMYWAKAIGCTPMSVPRASISNIEGNIKFTVNWKAQFVKDMDPVNLTELNYLTAKSMGINFTSGKDMINNILASSTIIPICNNQTWVGYPLIISGIAPENKGTIVRTGQEGTDYDKKATGFYRLIWVNKK